MLTCCFYERVPDGIKALQYNLHNHLSLSSNMIPFRSQLLARIVTIPL